MALPLKIRAVTNAADDVSPTTLSAEDYIDFFAGVTKLGRLAESGYTINLTVTLDTAISLKVKTSANVIFSFEYSANGSSGFTCNHVYVPTTTGVETTYYLDKYGNVYSDSNLTTSVDGTKLYVEEITLDSIEGLDTILEEITNKTSIVSALESNVNNQLFINTTIEITSVLEAYLKSLISSISLTSEFTDTFIYKEISQDIKITDSLEVFLKTLLSRIIMVSKIDLTQYSEKQQIVKVLESIDLHNSKIINQIISLYNIIEPFVNYAKSIKDFIYIQSKLIDNVIFTESLKETINIISEISSIETLFKRIIEHVTIQDGIFANITLKPLYTPEFRTDQFSLGNTSLKLLSGIKLFGEIPKGITVSLYFCIKGLWYQTGFIPFNPSNIAYFNVQGEYFKLHFRMPTSYNMSLNFFEIFWKQTDKSNIRSTYYYGAQSQS